MTGKQSADQSRRLRAGIVGGGRGSFIGAIHRIAAEMDGRARVVAGAMSSDPAVARTSADAWFLERSYPSFEEMARKEAELADGIDFVILATPNNLHYPAARAFLAAGIHVVCDKPLTVSLAEAEDLDRMVAAGTLLFAVTYAYTGYPTVREARALVQAGKLGELRRVNVEYFQDWLMEPVERTGNKQAAWRTDPTRAGPSCCVGDIGTHAENLLAFVSGQSIRSLCADVSSFVDGRELDDDANILLRLSGGAKGTLMCSQIACGEANRLSIRLYGSAAGLEWHQEEPNTLIFKPADEPWRYLRTGRRYMGEAATAMTRTPAGHPEGYLEAFANIYRGFTEDVARVGRGHSPVRDYPGVQDGLRGLKFVECVLASSRAGGTWMNLE
jgi:predicted dehydrogenase